MMTDVDEPTVEITVEHDGMLRVRVDRPGLASESARISVDDLRAKLDSVAPHVDEV
jgi:hypothetical protein